MSDLHPYEPTPNGCDWCGKPPEVHRFDLNEYEVTSEDPERNFFTLASSPVSSTFAGPRAAGTAAKAVASSHTRDT